MLRRARLVLPLLIAVAAALGGVLGDRWPWAVVVGLPVAALLGGRLDRIDQLAAARRDEEASRALRERFEALRSEQERVVRLLEALPTAVLLFGREGLVYANPTALQLFELDGAPGLSPIRALGVAGLAGAVAEAAEAEEPVTVGVTRDDRELVGRATSTGPGEVALIVTDLTSLQRVEAMRRDFVANASHELKTPVTGMRALADSLHLALDRDPARARTMVERIQAEAARLAQLVRDLLDLARLEEGADGRAPQRVDLAELCAQQVERLRPIADAAGVDLVLTGGDASVIGVQDDLKLVVGNLVHNAIQYNRPGGTVTVHVGRGDGTAVVEVADDGIGIPEADQERVFERFYRVDKARSRAAGGTGLGLSLIRHAVERHGGAVRVASVLGEGSTFTVELYDGGVIELDHTSPFELLIATVLSAQSTDKKINEITEHLFAKYRTPEDYLAVPEEELQADIKSSGFFRQKARAIRGICQVLVEDFDGEVPLRMADLLTLPGVARKTANVVLAGSAPDALLADPDAGIAVDTHVTRLSKRFGFTRHDDPVKIERDLLRLVPRERYAEASLVIILHGRRVCDALRPRCGACAVEPLCPSSLVAGRRDKAGQARGVGAP